MLSDSATVTVVNAISDPVAEELSQFFANTGKDGGEVDKEDTCGLS